MKYYKWFNKNTSSLRGKTVAVSGATGGIGVCVCEYLAYLGANIVCLDRNAQKSNKLIDNLKVKYPSLNAKHITLDLENMNQVKSVVESLKQIDIDYLILNAGAYKIPRHKCDTGFDNVFQINFVSPYYLARELAPLIKQKGGRVVAVSSIAHNYSKIDENDDNDKTLSVVHPGITFTNITNHYPKLIFTLIKHPMKIIFMKPKKAALCVILGLFQGCKSNEWIGPRVFNIWGLPNKKKLNTATYNESLLIGEISDEIYKKQTVI